MKITLSGVFMLLSCALALPAAEFVPGCSVPFKAIQTTGLGVDKQCGIDGASNDAAKKAESDAKNNFCVTGTPTPIAYATFSTLEDAVTDEKRKEVKKDRGVVKNVSDSMGEGTLVSYVGFLLEAHVSNKSKGELVNCNKGGDANNDIHIELVDSPNEDDACKSVTAEMSPHLRPESWTELPSLTIKRPVRLTGPLFFDGSHRPCRGDKRPSPNRISVWEIHPVYQFEICKNKSLDACKAEDNSVWVALDQWNSRDDPETDSNN
jgi:hypothetical protein